MNANTVSVTVHIHPTAELSPDAVIGEGTRIWHYVQIREGSRIGRDCVLGKGVYIDKNVVVGERCKIQNRATLYDGVTVGNEVFIGPHVCFTNDPFPRAVSADWEIVQTKVEDGASIGANATIVCGVTIGRFAMIGAGTVVTRDVPPHALVVGNPARVVGYVCVCGHQLDKEGGCEHCGRRIDLRGTS